MGNPRGGLKYSKCLENRQDVVTGMLGRIVPALETGICVSIAITSPTCQHVPSSHLIIVWDNKVKVPLFDFTEVYITME